MTKEEATEKWHLDRRVPIGIIVGLAIQTIVFVYSATSWSSKMESRMLAVEKQVSANFITNRRQYEVINEERLKSHGTAQALARVEGTLNSMERQLTTIVGHIMKDSK